MTTSDPSGDSRPGSEHPDSGAVHERLSELRKHSPTTYRYVEEEEVASGAMGRVLRVRDVDLGRVLAMKVALAQNEDGTQNELAVERFLDEAQVTGQLDHPGVVPIHELALDPHGRAYFTMPLVRGRTLGEVFELERSGASGWTRPRVLLALLKVCETMAYAHSKGVVHRDLKPDNIMLGRFGEVYVMDWGLARRYTLGAAAGAHSRGGDFNFAGTPAYMACEQALGAQPHPLGDVYSVGAILYHLLAGVMPYGMRATDEPVLERIQAAPPRPLETIDATLPAELVAIAQKAMARSIDERYRDMLSVAKDLGAYLEGHVVQAYESGKLAELRKWSWRNRRVVAAVGGVLFLALIGLASMQRGKLRAVRREVVQRESARREAIAQGYAANLHAADVSLRVGELNAAEAHLQACDPQSRHFEWHYLNRRTDSSLARYTGSEFGLKRIIWSSAAGRIVAGDKEGVLRSWDASTRESLGKLAEFESGITAMCAVERHSALAVATQEGGAWLIDAQTGSRIARIGSASDVSALALNHAGSLLVMGTIGGYIKAYDVAQVRQIPDVWSRRVEANGVVYAIAFTPDDAGLLLGSSSLNARLFNAATGDLERVFEETIRARAIAVSPDGEWVAIGDDERRVHLWELHTGFRRELNGHTGSVRALQFSPDSSELASGDTDGLLLRWDVESGRQRLAHLGHLDAVTDLVFEPDGSRLLSSSLDRTLREWSEATPGEELVYHAEFWVESLDMDRRGDRLAGIVRTAEEHWKVLLWDATSFALTGTIELGGTTDTLALDPVRSRVYVGAVDGRVFAYDLESAAIVATFTTDGKPNTAVAVDSTGERLAAGSHDGAILVFDLGAAGAEPLRLAGHTNVVDSLAFRPGHQQLASGSWDGAVNLYDATTGELLSTTSNPDRVRTIAFNPEGSLLACGVDDDTIRLWSVDGTSEVRTLTGHSKRVRALRFSADGARLASGSDDGTIRIWEPVYGNSLLVLRGHSRYVNDVVFRPDGAGVFSASRDGDLRVWDGAARGPVAGREPTLSVGR